MQHGDRRERRRDRALDVELGRNLGLHVTAEGVESESVARSLGELGCTTRRASTTGDRSRPPSANG